MRSEGGLYQEERLYRYLLWMTMAASAIIFFWGTWSLPILSLNEGRRMVVIREMLSGGNWLLPTLGEKIYITKPPVFYWVAGLLALVFHSSSEWVMRLPSSLSALFLTWFTFGQVKKHVGRWPALFSAIVLVTSYKFTVYARRAEIEMLLALCCTTAMFLFLDYLKKPEAHWPLYLSYLFWGLAFMVKGPAALPFFLPPLLLFWLLRRDRNVLRGLLSLRGWAILLLVALPWYIYSYLKLGGGRWEWFLEKDILGKTYWAKERDPFYRYLLDLLINFSPWILLAFYRTRDRWRSLFSSYESSFWSCWFFVPFIIVGTCAIKHAKYILPSFPAVAALLGIWAASAFVDLRQRTGPKAHQITLAAVGTLFCGWVLFYSLAEPYFLNYRYSSIKPMILKIQQIRGNAPVFSYNHKYERLIYYYQRPIRHVHEGNVSQMLRRHKSFLLIAEDKYWEELEDEGLCPLAEYRPFLHRNKAARLYGSPDFCERGEGSIEGGASFLVSRSHLFEFPATPLSLWAATSIHTLRASPAKDSRISRAQQIQHLLRHLPDLPLRAIAEAFAEEVQELAGVHGDEDLAHAGIGEQIAGILVAGLPGPAQGLVQHPIPLPHLLHGLSEKLLRIHPPSALLDQFSLDLGGQDVIEVSLLHIALAPLGVAGDAMPNQLMGHGPGDPLQIEGEAGVLQRAQMAPGSKLSHELPSRLWLLSQDALGICRIAELPCGGDDLLRFRGKGNQGYFGGNGLHERPPLLII
jgi:4-amino-4-deoxy-L-arabinose transferase-like glycosyltransferase